MHQNNSGIYGRDAGQRSKAKAKVDQPSGGPTRNPEEPNVYLKTKVLTASPAELRLMLIDGAIRFTKQARVGILERDFEQSFEGFSKARAIVTELISGLNPEVDAELCDRLTGLYTFIFTRLVDASSERSIEIIDEVLELFRFERETWAMLVQSLASENASASSVTEVPVERPTTSPEKGGGSGLPTAGRISATG